MKNISLNSSNAIKGIAALCVILHHISQNLSNPYFLYIFQWFGTLSVSIFFFFSGYGISYQFYNKKNYLDSFWKRRLSKILIPFFLSNIIFILYNVIVNDANYSINDILIFTTGIKLINGYAWYIIVILWLYIGFWVSYKFIKNQYLQLSILSLFIFIYIGWCILNHLSTFVSIFSFPLGILYVQNINKIKIKYPVLLIATLFITFSFLLYEASLMVHINNLKNVVICIVECLCFSSLIVLIIGKYEIKNKILIFFGSVSLEIYLIQGLFLKLVLEKSEILSVIIIIPLTILSGYLFKSLNKKIEDILILKNSKNY